MKVRFFINLIVFSVLLHGRYGMSATVVFSSLSSFNTYDYSGRGIQGSNSPFGYSEVANRFIPTSGGTLGSIELGLGYLNTPDEIDVSLRLDDALYPFHDFPSSSSLFSQTVTTSFAFGSNSNLLTIIPSTTILLSPNTGYWVVVKPHSPNSSDAWSFGSIAGDSAFSTDGGLTWRSQTGDTMGALRISTVPEPSVLSLIVIGLMGATVRMLPVNSPGSFQPSKRELGK